ncbi:hypothetical protein HDV00_011792 [Rhizophlyctis rosea]|nr:hypothetical protein HDV00_011792 [Rhizophlyctis rosea]
MTLSQFERILYYLLPSTFKVDAAEMQPTHSRKIALAIPFLAVYEEEKDDSDPLVADSKERVRILAGMILTMWTKLPVWWRQYDGQEVDSRSVWEFEKYMAEYDRKVLNQLHSLHSPEQESNGTLHRILYNLAGQFFTVTLSLHTVIFIFDQLLFSSTEFTRDPTYPPIDKWITWVCVAVLHIARAEVLAVTDANQLTSLFRTRLSNITPSHLSSILEALFIAPLRPMLNTRPTTPFGVIGMQLDSDGQPSDNRDGKEDESDIIESEMAGNAHLTEWEQRRERTRKKRLDGLMKRWRDTAHKAGYWMIYINEIRSDARRTRHLRLSQPTASAQPQQTVPDKPKPARLPPSSVLPAATTSAAKSRGNMPTDQSVLIRRNGSNVTLTDFGALLRRFVEKTDSLLGSSPDAIATEVARQAAVSHTAAVSQTLAAWSTKSGGAVDINKMDPKQQEQFWADVEKRRVKLEKRQRPAAQDAAADAPSVQASRRSLLS